MEWKQILLWVSIFIIIVTFYRMVQHRRGFFQIKEGMDDKSKSDMDDKSKSDMDDKSKSDKDDKSKSDKDGKSKSDKDSGAWNSDSSNNIDCSNSYTDSKSLPLREYFVKSSFNSAYNGNDVSTNALGLRLAEGYRFLDLNVFSASGGNLFVGFSPDNSPTMVSTTLPFETALKFIYQWGFTNNKDVVLPKPLIPDDTTPPPGVATLRQNCYSYPLFVHIRVYRAPNSQEDIVSKVATAINGLNYPQFYRDTNNKPIQVNGCTTIDKIMGKIIFTMDIENIIQIYAPTNTPSAEYVPADTMQSIQSFVNMLTGGSTCLAFYDYTDPQIVAKTNKLRISDQAKNAYKTNVQYMFIVFPNPLNPDNPDASSIVKNNSIQYIPMRAYILDSANGNLAKYNKIFETLKVPFAPMGYVYTTINNQK